MSAMRPETGLRTILLESAEVAAFIGDRLERTVVLQDSEYPFGIFARAKTDPHYTMSGSSNLREVDVMFAWHHTDFDDLADLVKAVEDALSGFSGTVSIEAKTLEIDTVYLTDERDGDTLAANGTGEPLYCIEQFFRVAYCLT